MNDSEITKKYDIIVRCKEVDPAIKLMEKLREATFYAGRVSPHLSVQLRVFLETARKYIGEAA